MQKHLADIAHSLHSSAFSHPSIYQTPTVHPKNSIKLLRLQVRAKHHDFKLAELAASSGIWTFKPIVGETEWILLWTQITVGEGSDPGQTLQSPGLGLKSHTPTYQAGPWVTQSASLLTSFHLLTCKRGVNSSVYHTGSLWGLNELV